MTKTLQAALNRRAAMIESGAPAANIAVMNERIERLSGAKTPTTGTCTDVADDPVIAEFDRIMLPRLADLDARRAKIAALKAELAREEALLDAAVSAVLFTAPLDDLVVEVSPDNTNTEVNAPAAAEAPTVEAGDRVENLAEIASPAPNPISEPDFAEAFADFEPEHVAAVASGAPARFVRGPNQVWFIAARAAQVDPLTGEVVIQRRDGSEAVLIVDSAVATANGIAVYSIYRGGAATTTATG